MLYKKLDQFLKTDFFGNGSVLYFNLHVCIIQFASLAQFVLQCFCTLVMSLEDSDVVLGSCTCGRFRR